MDISDLPIGSFTPWFILPRKMELKMAVLGIDPKTHRMKVQPWHLLYLAL